MLVQGNYSTHFVHMLQFCFGLLYVLVIYIYIYVKLRGEYGLQISENRVLSKMFEFRWEVVKEA